MWLNVSETENSYKFYGCTLLISRWILICMQYDNHGGIKKNSFWAACCVVWPWLSVIRLPMPILKHSPLWILHNATGYNKRDMIETPAPQRQEKKPQTLFADENPLWWRKTWRPILSVRRGHKQPSQRHHGDKSCYAGRTNSNFCFFQTVPQQFFA